MDVRKDGRRGSNFWFQFPYRPDFSVDELSCDCSDDLREGSDVVSLEIVRANISEAIGFSSNPFVPTGLGSPPTFKRPSISRHGDSFKQPSKVLRILLVDDSLTIIKVTARSLRSQGHEVETKSNGSAALDRLILGYPTNDFNLVLMDLQMPVMDGIEAVRRYREFENMKRLEDKVSSSLKKLAIIGMSANSDTATKNCALDAGMNLFIAKPFILQDLQPLICQLLFNKENSFRSRHSSKCSSRSFASMGSKMSSIRSGKSDEKMNSVINIEERKFFS